MSTDPAAATPATPQGRPAAEANEAPRPQSSATPIAPGNAQEVYRLDEPTPYHPRCLSLRREVLERSSLAVVEIDMERRIRYANPAALRLLGAPASYLDVSLDSLFIDDRSQEVLDEELARRRAGLIGNYRIKARRISDQHAIAIEITGLPIMDDHGKVVISIGLFRSLEQQEFAESVRKIGTPGQSPDKLLGQLAVLLKQSIPFDRLSVSRMSSDGNHLSRIFAFGWDRPLLRIKRWWPLTDAQKQWYASPESNYIADLVQFMENPLWAQYKEDPVVKDILSSGIKSVLRRDVHRDGRTVCTLTLMSTKLDGFDKERQELFLSPPVAAVVLQAYEHMEKTRVTQRLELLKALNRCTSVAEACSLLATRLVEIFGWSHVSIFRVDRSAGTLRLLAQHWQSDDPIQLPENYQQPQNVGILGRVIATEKAQNVGDVTKDPDYVRSISSGRVMSELCVPVMSKTEPGVRWIINVEDEQESAFACDELIALGEVAEEVGAMMQRIADLFFLTQCFEHASEAIFVTDAHLGLRKVNPAAAHLLGYNDAAQVRGNLADYLAEPAGITRLHSPGAGDLGEFMLKQTGLKSARTADAPANEPDRAPPTVPAFISRRDFPEGLTGSIFIARDTSAMRKTVQTGVLEKAAYSIAAETCTPLAAAVAALERIGRTSANVPNDTLQRVLRQLGRVQQSYRRLAMFEPNARPKASLFTPLNLQAELEALARNLADSGEIAVEPAASATQPLILGDYFQIGFILETLLTVMLRYAPESEPVSARVSVTGTKVKVELRGYLDASIPEQQLDAAWVPSDADMAIAKPLLDEFVGNHNGSWLGAVGKDRHALIDITFPLSGH